MILEAPYTSIVEVGKSAYPWLPVEYLLSDRYETDKVIVATGARPGVPEIAGIETVPYLTSTTALELEELPLHGGGQLPCGDHGAYAGALPPQPLGVPGGDGVHPRGHAAGADAGPGEDVARSRLTSVANESRVIVQNYPRPRTRIQARSASEGDQYAAFARACDHPRAIPSLARRACIPD